MIGCLRTRIRKQPIIALYFEFENELKFYNLGPGFPAIRPILSQDYCLVVLFYCSYVKNWKTILATSIHYVSQTMVRSCTQQTVLVWFLSGTHSTQNSLQKEVCFMVLLIPIYHKFGKQLLRIVILKF